MIHICRMTSRGAAIAVNLTLGKELGPATPPSLDKVQEMCENLTSPHYASKKRFVLLI